MTGAPRILLCAAVEEELAPLVEEVTEALRRDAEAPRRDPDALRRDAEALPKDAEALRRNADFPALEVTLAPLVTGVGKVHAAIAITRALLEAPAALVIQAGSAGAFASSGLAPGDVALSSEEVLADEGAEGEGTEGEGAEGAGGFLPLERLGLSGAPCRIALPLAEEVSPDVLRLAAGGRFRVVRGRTITVSTVAGTARTAAAREALWSPLAESMEGAAGAFAARAAGCPFLEVRGISNLAGPRERGAWQIERAARHAAIVAAAAARALLGAPGAAARWAAR